MMRERRWCSVAGHSRAEVVSARDAGVMQLHAELQSIIKNSFNLSKPLVRLWTGMGNTKPTVKRPGLGRPVQKAGLPRPSQLPATGNAQIKYQQVFHLNPNNLLAYEDMTHPSLRARWKRHPRRGELLGVSASVEGVMVRLAVAKRFSQGDSEPIVELLSLRVAPQDVDAGIELTLIRHLEKLVGRPLRERAD